MIYLGIDPGKSGGMAALSSTGSTKWAYKFENMTERDLADIFESISGSKVFTVMERLHAMPARFRGNVGNWNLGEHYGMLKGFLFAYRIPFELVVPQKWQKAIGCLSKGDKNVTKSKAQALFPDRVITHWNADAYLIAEYNRRTYG
jgi:hypothetical protein